MSIYVVLLLMMFCHIVDDYYLQGILVKLKQKETWKDAESKYKYDYIMALFMHAFSWAFMIMLPILWFVSSWHPPVWFYVVFVLNIVIHSIVDNLKCNMFKINLIQDQLIHLLQIVLTWSIFI